MQRTPLLRPHPQSVPAPVVTVTLMVNVVVVVPSLTVTTTLSAPTKPSAGMYTTLPASLPVPALKLPPPLGVPNDTKLMAPAAPVAAARGSSTYPAMLGGGPEITSLKGGTLSTAGLGTGDGSGLGDGDIQAARHARVWESMGLVRVARCTIFFVGKHTDAGRHAEDTSSAAPPTKRARTRGHGHAHGECGGGGAIANRDDHAVRADKAQCRDVHHLASIAARACTEAAATAGCAKRHKADGPCSACGGCEGIQHVSSDAGWRARDHVAEGRHAQHGWTGHRGWQRARHR